MYYQTIMSQNYLKSLLFLLFFGTISTLHFLKYFQKYRRKNQCASITGHFPVYCPYQFRSVQSRVKLLHRQKQQNISFPHKTLFPLLRSFHQWKEKELFILHTLVHILVWKIQK